MLQHISPGCSEFSWINTVSAALDSHRRKHALAFRECERENHKSPKSTISFKGIRASDKEVPDIEKAIAGPDNA